MTGWMQREAENEESEIDRLKAELAKWEKSFSGHVYVTTEKYAALVAERDALNRLLREVSAHFTRDDDLPDNLLPRIDAALDAVKEGRE